MACTLHVIKVLRREKKYVSLNQYIQNIIISICNHIKIINEIFYILVFGSFVFSTKSLKLSIIYTSRTSPFRPAVLQVLNSHMWLVATMLDNIKTLPSHKLFFFFNNVHLF